MNADWKKGILAVSALLLTSAWGAAPDLPIAGWATQNGGTTGGQGKTVVTVSNVSDLRKYAEAGNYTIYVKPGTYKVPSKNAIKVGSNVTIYGYQGAIMEQTATSTKNEDNTVISVEGKNVIIRNLVFKGSGAIDLDAGDCMHVKGGTNVWIDHVEIYDGQDGNLDVINGANYVTISWTKFHYTSASKEHMFSNLIGNSDSKTSDQGKLKTTIHHSWWGKGVKERMPRVRFGEVHVANNLFSSDASSTCVRAGKNANLRVENNVFIGVNNPVDLYEKDFTAVTSSGNYKESVKKGDDAGSGTAFVPAYTMALTDVSTQQKAYALKDSIEQFAGATLANPDGSGQSISSSSVAKSSSSQAVSSSSSKAQSSSSAAAEAASLTKRGVGSSNQTVHQGEAIAEFYYDIVGATGATISGLPQGISGTLSGTEFHISGTVSESAPAGSYPFTVTTVGAAKNATKTGTITVLAAEISSSSAQVSSSSSEKFSSSSKETSSSSSAEELSSSSFEESSSSSEAATAIPLSEISPLKISVNGRTLNVFAAKKNAQFLVCDLQGRVLSRGKIATENFSIEIPKSGMYLVKIGSETKKFQIK